MKEQPEDVEEFFWGHFRKDAACLAEALGRNTEDAVLTVHLFLRHLSNDNLEGREMLGSSGRSPAGLWWSGFNQDLPSSRVPPSRDGLHPEKPVRRGGGQ